MMKHTAQNIHAEQHAAVLTKALRNTADRLGLHQKALGLIIGCSEATSSRLYRGDKQISPDTKEGEMALLIIRIFRSLSAILGSDTTKCQQWFHTYNTHLNGVPSQLATRIEGLNNVACYLDAMRGKL